MTERDKLSRRQRERRRHKEEILAAALKLFSEKGFHDVSMQEIAAEAEFATGTLYNFFASKEALFEEMTLSWGDRIVSDLTAILDGPGDEVARLRAFVRHQPALLEKYAEFIKVYVSEFGTRGAKVSKERKEDEFHAILDTKLTQLLEAGIAKGVFRPVDAIITAKTLHSIMETLAFEIAGHFDKAQATDAFAKVEQLFLEGLLLPGACNDE
ncbi:MAG: TetR/AcrR family transcriptional regulator [Sedimentisphaerales bacterium]|nr:TetR/AcrR family transcriptional regulator [Sedimentisphaerales bacterium]